ncbi:hypothetical protein NDU88_005394 [Pleurodeles waltl]|uniref:Uncharacterized protein n=1 Tax=Pleurodeles waltl TaxID=8319 RepID=A0AAV7TUP6_PLEWA|nr:hypothetical protein NDU88_005394 [Pleurodeles waltl]
MDKGVDTLSFQSQDTGSEYYETGLRRVSDLQDGMMFYETGVLDDVNVVEQEDVLNHTRCETFNVFGHQDKSEESVDVFYACLRQLATTITLPDEEDEIRAQCIEGCASSKLIERILQEPNMRMRDILTLGRSQELSKANVTHMEQTTTVQVKSEAINVVVTGNSKGKMAHIGAKPRDRLCRWCSATLLHPSGCPARGKTCSACGKLNHFVKMCHLAPKVPPTPKKTIKAVSALPTTSSDSDTDDDQKIVHVVRTVDKGEAHSLRLPSCQVTMQSQSFSAPIDTRASINLMAARCTTA